MAVDAVGNDFEIPVDGPISTKRNHFDTEIETVPSVEGAWANEMSFLEEPVEIFLHESSDPNEEPMVYININGEPAVPGSGGYLIRGRQYTIKRKFAQQLAQAKVTSFSQPFKDAPGEQQNVMRPRTTQRYPFSVIRDDNPKGAKWLAGLMAA